MKIVSWNCNGALRKKLEEIDFFEADLLLVQECEDPKYSTKYYREWAGDYLWVGTNRNKGLGVFPKRGNRVSELNWQGEYTIRSLKKIHESITWRTVDLRLFLPFKLNNQYTVLGVWTKGNESEVFGYIGQFWKYLQIHDNDLSGPNTLILGDFNSNAIWDKSDRWWNHSGVIDELGQLSIHSIYHHVYGEKQGQETRPTFYLHRNTNKPYHIDYAFSSSNLIESSDITIGKAADWLKFSDHMPLIITVEI